MGVGEIWSKVKPVAIPLAVIVVLVKLEYLAPGKKAFPVVGS